MTHFCADCTSILAQQPAQATTNLPALSADTTRLPQEWDRYENIQPRNSPRVP